MGPDSRRGAAPLNKNLRETELRGRDISALLNKTYPNHFLITFLSLVTVSNGVVGVAVVLNFLHSIGST